MRSESIYEKVMGLVFDFPARRFHVREISRILFVSAPTVSKAVRKLEEKGLVECRRGFVFEITAKQGGKFRGLKMSHNLKRIHSSGLAAHLAEKFPLSAVILFGPYSRGEDADKSRIDVAVLGREKRMDLEEFERKLGRRVNLVFADFRKAPRELKESIVNGVVLSGSMALK